MRKVAVFSGFLILLACVFMLAPKRREQPAPVGVEAPAPEVLRTVYDEGHQKGYQALFAQMAYMDRDPSLADFKEEGTRTEVRYTSNVHDEEEFMRGYVDGYHRAAQMYDNRKILNGPRCPY